MASLNVRGRQFGNERGSQMVEFALIAPLLLLVIAGIADFGFLFQSFEVTTNAAREAARVAILPGFDENDYQAPKDRVDDYIASANLLGTYTTSIEPTTFDLGDEEVSGVNVVITYTQPMWIIGPIAGLMNGTFQNSITYNTGAQMRTEIQATVPPAP